MTIENEGLIPAIATRLCLMRGQKPHDPVDMNEHGYFIRAQQVAEADVRDWLRIEAAVRAVVLAESFSRGETQT